MQICQNGGMNPQLSQDYDVDARYHGGKRSVDNEAAKYFVRRYIRDRQAQNRPNMAEEQSTEGRFIMQGPGEAGYTFRNAFRPSK